MDKPRRPRPILGQVAYPTPSHVGPGLAPSRIAILGAAAFGNQGRSRYERVPSFHPPQRWPTNLTPTGLRARRERPGRSPAVAERPQAIHTPSPTNEDSCGPPASAGSHCRRKPVDAPQSKHGITDTRSEDNQLFSPRFSSPRPVAHPLSDPREVCFGPASRIDARVPSATPADLSPPFRHCLIVALRRITAVSDLARSDPLDTHRALLGGFLVSRSFCSASAIS